MKTPGLITVNVDGAYGSPGSGLAQSYGAFFGMGFPVFALLGTVLASLQKRPKTIFTRLTPSFPATSTWD